METYTPPSDIFSTTEVNRDMSLIKLVIILADEGHPKIILMNHYV